MLDELTLPDLPAGAVRETNGETVERLGRDVTLIGDNQLSAVDSYRLYGYDERDRPFWGYGVEAARVVNSADVLILVRSDEEVGVDRALRWMSLSQLYTRGQALLFYEVLDTEGPTEEAMLEILKLLREVFEFAMDTNWSYRARLEFYHAFPFEELTSKEAVVAFRPNIFDCPAFARFERRFA